MAQETMNEAVVFQRPDALLPVVTNYCPGCAHGIVNRLVAEVMDDMDIEGKTIGVAPVGCSVLSYDFFGCDMIEAETVHAATRGENITIVFVNNAIYGMTGGQMAPTSLPNQITQTSPYGRDSQTAGYPIRVCELLSTLDGVAYLERVTVDTPKHVRAAKKAIRHAFDNQIQGVGYSLVEVVSTCPTNWKMTPQESFAWMRENMLPYYPLGVYKDVQAEGFANAAEAALARAKDCPMVEKALKEGM